MNKLLASSVFATLVAGPAWAAPQTVILSVAKMTCAACPITVKTALSRVPGVTEVSVSLERKQATVVFDDAKTTVRSEEHTSELQSQSNLVCRLLLEKKKETD